MNGIEWDVYGPGAFVVQQKENGTSGVFVFLKTKILGILNMNEVWCVYVKQINKTMIYGVCDIGRHTKLYIYIYTRNNK